MQADRIRAERDAEEIIELTVEVARLRLSGTLHYQSLAKYGRDPEWADVDRATHEEFMDAAYTVLEAGR